MGFAQLHIMVDSTTMMLGAGVLFCLSFLVRPRIRPLLARLLPEPGPSGQAGDRPRRTRRPIVVPIDSRLSEQAEAVKAGRITRPPR